MHYSKALQQSNLTADVSAVKELHSWALTDTNVTRLTPCQDSDEPEPQNLSHQASVRYVHVDMNEDLDNFRENQ